jgi:predicted permease
MDSSRILPALCASAVKLIISPIVAWGICLSLAVNREQLGICVLESAMPTAVLVTIFSVQYEADPVFSNAIVSLTTLAGMGAIPVLFFLLK